MDDIGEWEETICKIGEKQIDVYWGDPVSPEGTLVAGAILADTRCVICEE